MVVAHVLEFLAGEAEEAVVGRLSRETARCFLGIVARRQSPFRAREVRGAAAEERGLTEFLRLLFRLGDEDLLQVAEVLAPGRVAFLHRGVAVQIPQLDR